MIGSRARGSRQTLNLCKKDRWLFGPVGDFFGIFFIPLVSVGYFVTPHSESVGVIYWLWQAPSNLLLSGGHLWGPILLYLFSSTERSRIHAIQPRTPTWIALCLAFPLLLMVASIYFHLKGDTSTQKTLFAINGSIYLLWNGYHFMAQQRGLLTVYRRKLGPLNRAELKFDQLFCFALLFIAPMASWSFAGLRFYSPELLTGFTLFRDSELRWSQYLAWGAGFISVLGLVRHFFFSQLQSLPTILMYLIISIQSIGMVLHPLFFTLVVFSATHWLQEIYLITNYSEGALKRSRVLTFIGLLLISIGSYLVYTHVLKSHTVSPFGSHRGLFNLSPYQYSLLAAFIGLVGGVSLVHFFLDRFIHRGRSWGSASD